jgi:putative phage-type endonuclease
MKDPRPYNINGTTGLRWDCDTNEEWRHERAKSIGASAIGTIFGESHFTTPMELAEKMRAELRGEFDYEQNIAMMRGHAYEPGVAYLFEQVTKKEVIKSSSREYLMRKDGIPFMHISPDRTYWIDSDGQKYGKNSEANKGILECKTTRRPIDPNDLPMSWVFQLQAQLGISGYKEGYLAWDVLSVSDGFGYKRFEFDPEIFEAAVEVCKDYWTRCIEGGEDPDPVAPRDILKRYPSSIEGKTITATSDIVELISSIKEMQAASKELSTEIDEAKSKLIMMFTDEEAIVAPETGKPIVTYKTKKGATRVDSKLLKADYPEVFAKVSKQDNDSRTLLIK